jgi:hypothetical protein
MAHRSPTPTRTATSWPISASTRETWSSEAGQGCQGHLPIEFPTGCPRHVRQAEFDTKPGHKKQQGLGRGHPVRCAYVSELLTRHTVPKGTLRYVSEAIMADRSGLAEGDGNQVAAIIGKESNPRAWDRTPALALTADATDAQLPLVLLAQVAASVEARFGERQGWRHPSAALVAYLSFLAAWGYGLSEVEQRWSASPTEPRALHKATNPDQQSQSTSGPAGASCAPVVGLRLSGPAHDFPTFLNAPLSTPHLSPRRTTKCQPPNALDIRPMDSDRTQPLPYVPPP